MIRLLLLTILILTLKSSLIHAQYVLVKPGENATIPLPAVASYWRTVKNADNKNEWHLYRVCRGKNNDTCGYWEDKKTKKKIASGVTTYNKLDYALNIENVRDTDYGIYMTENKKWQMTLLKLDNSSSSQENLRNAKSIWVKLGANATLPLPPAANYRRSIRIPYVGYMFEEHLYRVCNGKNNKTCGYWENVKTKKRMQSGATIYDKDMETLVVHNVQKRDYGYYMTGDKKTQVTLVEPLWKG